MSKLRLLKKHKTFEGYTSFWEHDSTQTKTAMKFSTYVPSGKVKGALIWLSGLTCTDENFITKAGAQKFLAKHQLMVICPDTSPRGLNLPQEHDSIDFGSGAGFYLDATAPEYSNHYRMFSYVTEELYEILQTEFQVSSQAISIFGHSMGGHGALIIGLKQPTKFKSVSAFAPIVNPSNGPWGLKAFAGYLGNDRSMWQKYDATELVKSGHRHPHSILIEQGTEDEFLKKQLLIENFKQACFSADQALEVRYQEGFDHSYYFISTFIESHIEFHAAALSH